MQTLKTCFSERLRALRKSKGFRAQEMADRLDVNIKGYRHYEEGMNLPRMKGLVALAAMLDVSVDYLLCRTDRPEPGKSARGTAVFSLGRSLRRLRDGMGIDRKEMAARLGLFEQSYGHYENESQYPRIEKLIEMAEYFGMDIDSLLGRGTARFSPALPSLPSLARFVDVLALCMEKEEVSVQEVAEHLGTPARAFERYASGGRNPTPAMLVALGDLFGVSVDYLLGRTEDPTFRDRRRTGES